MHRRSASLFLPNPSPSLPSPQTKTALRPPTSARAAAPRPLPSTRSAVACDAASMQFIKGIDEPTVPEVSLRRARTGTSGSAVMMFDNPSIFQASGELGEITGEGDGLGRKGVGFGVGGGVDGVVVWRAVVVS
jgi:hypothetical protein